MADDLGDGVLCTDLRNGRRLVARFGAEIRYVPQWRRWLVFRDGQWSIDEDQVRLRAMAKEVVQGLYQEARAFRDAGKAHTAQEVRRWAVRCETPARLTAMIRSLPGDERVHLDARDAECPPYSVQDPRPRGRRAR